MGKVNVNNKQCAYTIYSVQFSLYYSVTSWVKGKLVFYHPASEHAHPPLRANCARSVPHHGGGRQRQGARATRQPAPCLVGMRPRPRARQHHTWAPSDDSWGRAIC